MLNLALLQSIQRDESPSDSTCHELHSVSTINYTVPQWREPSLQKIAEASIWKSLAVFENNWQYSELQMLSVLTLLLGWVFKSSSTSYFHCLLLTLSMPGQISLKKPVIKPSFDQLTSKWYNDHALTADIMICSIFCLWIIYLFRSVSSVTC